MKIADVKHNHSLTDLLKILLFTILMLAPVGMVASRCLYVIANKNAYQSYSDALVDNQVNITNGAQLQEGAILQLNYVSYNEGSYTYSNTFYFSEINLNLQEIFGQYNSNYTYDAIRFRSDGYIYISVYGQNGTEINQSNLWGNTIKNISLRLKAPLVNSNTITQYGGNLDIYQYQYKINTLDNVFEYSVSQLEQSPLFNWTQNTAIFSGINAMNTQLGINSPAIGIILTYWLILTCIYVIIDIVIRLFTMLTHAIGSKTRT